MREPVVRAESELVWMTQWMTVHIYRLLLSGKTFCLKRIITLLGLQPPPPPLSSGGRLDVKYSCAENVNSYCGGAIQVAHMRPRVAHKRLRVAHLGWRVAYIGNLHKDGVNSNWITGSTNWTPGSSDGTTGSLDLTPSPQVATGSLRRTAITAN
jgi:hypothetical protein